RAVDAGRVDDVLLACAVLLRGSDQHDVLACREVDACHLLLEELGSALVHTVQQMQRRAVELAFVRHSPPAASSVDGILARTQSLNASAGDSPNRIELKLVPGRLTHPAQSVD